MKNAVSEILESNLYESFQTMNDFSDVEQLGVYFDNLLLNIKLVIVQERVPHFNVHLSFLGFEEDEFSLEEYFLEQPIWRIPVHGITVHFGDRVDSRDFAKTLAKAIADGNGK